MSNLPQSSLPYFDPERPLLVSKGQFREHAQLQTGEESFLRYVYTTGPYGESLDERIERTESELSRLAKLCGAQVVNHTYGLYPIEDPRYLYLTQPAIVPDDSVLAAEVQIVRDQPLYRPRPLRIYRGIMQYKDQGGTLCDIRAGQFAWGRQSDGLQEQNSWILLDIEPRHTHPAMRRYTRL